MGRILFLPLAVFLFSFAVLFAQPAPSADSDEVELTIVKLAGLEKAIKSHQGKVVVVYMWGDYSWTFARQGPLRPRDLRSFSACRLVSGVRQVRPTWV
jgi:hypothetical protein